LISDADRERTTRATLADHGYDNRHFDFRHLAQVVRDRFRLTAFFGVNAGISAGRVDEREDRASKLLAEFHHAQRFAITLGFRHAEVSITALLRVATFLMTHDDYRQAMKASEPANDCRVFRKSLVAMQLNEVFK
jgi:hypothetical protein